VSIALATRKDENLLGVFTYDQDSDRCSCSSI
jgi:hypothetical protein